MELHNKTGQAAGRRISGAYSGPETRNRPGEDPVQSSSHGLDELCQQLAHINGRFDDKNDDLSGITDDILKLQQVLNAVCESHDKSKV